MWVSAWAREMAKVRKAVKKIDTMANMVGELEELRMEGGWKK